MKSHVVSQEAEKMLAVGSGGFLIWGVSPAEIAALCTAAYFAGAFFYTMWKWYKEYRESKRVIKD